MLSVEKNDRPAVMGNLQKARKKWGRFSCLLLREGADSKTSVIFYLVVVQCVFILEADMWVVMHRILKNLIAFTTGWHVRYHVGCPGG